MNACLSMQNSSAQLCHLSRKENRFKPAEDTKENVIAVKIGNKTFKALIHTGASQTLVSVKCVPKTHLKHEAKLRIKCIHGEEQIYPTADVNIEINGQTYLLNVEKTPYAVILDLLVSKHKTAEIFTVTRI